MNYSSALVHLKVSHAKNRFLGIALSVIIGVTILTTLSQIKIQLNWTPVPITGQTLGVTFMALLWGSRLSLITYLTYLALGFLGAPVFSGGNSGFEIMSPSFGYLIGMLVSAFVIGLLSDMGWARNFKKALFAAYIGTFCTMICGLIGLSFLLPLDQLISAGIIPFLLGDLIKNLLATSIVSGMH